MTNVRRLPGPIADVWEWQHDGACRGRDSASFAVTAVRTMGATPRRWAQVITPCAAWAERTHTRTVCTVIPLSSMEETTNNPDHYGVSGESVENSLRRRRVGRLSMTGTDDS